VCRTLGELIQFLMVFALRHEVETAAIDRADPSITPQAVANRANTEAFFVREFRATVGIERVRDYVLARHGEELTIATARKLVGDLIRERGLTVKEAEALSLEAAMDRLEAPTPPGGQADPAPPATPGGPPKRNAKRSTKKGDGRVKLIAALTKHHDYANGSCLNTEPINNNELARLAGVDKATASAFFKKEFAEHSKYVARCRDAAGLAAALKLLNGEFAPKDLCGHRPAGEDTHDDG
jgi:hypothetical protein